MKEIFYLVLIGLLSVWFGAAAETFENVNDKTAIHELTLTGVTKPVVGEMPHDEASLGDKVVIDSKCWSVHSEAMVIGILCGRMEC